MELGTICFKNGTSVTISELAARDMAVALDSYWEKPDGSKRVIRQGFTDSDGQPKVIRVDLESVMWILSR